MLKGLAPNNYAAINGSAKNGSLRHLTIPSDPAEAQQVQQEVEAALKAYHCDEKHLFSIKLALEEALVNAIKHGNQLDRSKTVSVAYAVASDRFEIHIEDEGCGFDPEDVPDPLSPENLERPCGRGLMLMKHYMCEVNVHSPGNKISLIKHLTNGSEK